MQKLILFLMRLGVVEGLTFRTRVEDGVGVFIEPNPTPNRMHPQAVTIADSAPDVALHGTGRRFWIIPASGNRRQRRASGHWIAKPLHVTWL